MRAIIFASLLAFVCLSNFSQANFVEDQNNLIKDIIVKEQTYENALLEFKFLEELKRIAFTIHAIHDVNPKGTTLPVKVLDQLNKINTGDLCTKCQNAVYAARNDTDKDAVKERFEKWAADICDKVNNATFCTKMATAYGNIVFPAIIDKSFNPELLCEKLHFCPDTTHKQVLKDYVDEVMKDKPATSIPTPTKRSTYTILQMTDIHIDLDYQEGANSVCSQPLCCRASDGQPTDPTQAAGYWGTLANCDIPVRTFDQFLQFAKSNFDIDMIFWTGDNAAHNIWEQSIDTQTVNTYDATQHILQYFPNTPLYPMFGNHEAFPSDEFDFTGNNSAWLTSSLADMWKIWLDDNADNTLRNNSYYAMVNQEHNVKVIALDTLACDSNDMYLFENATDPQNQLAWLRSELYNSEASGQGVFIMGHIPPGSFACDSEWSSRYRALIDRFTNIIRGQFFAHTHNDQIEMVRSYADNSPVGVIYIAPSLTTYSYLNPSFRIFEIDSDTNLPINYYQYRLDLNKWNQNTTGPLQWDLAYDVLAEYDLPDMSYRSFDNLVEKIKEDKEVAKLFSDNFYTGNPVNVTLDDRDIQHLYCLAKNSVSKDAFKCLGLYADMNDILDMAEQMLPGGWTD